MNTMHLEVWPDCTEQKPVFCNITYSLETGSYRNANGLCKRYALLVHFAHIQVLSSRHPCEAGPKHHSIFSTHSSAKPADAAE